MKNVLLLKAGDAAQSVRLSVGDDERWFLRTIGLSGYRFDLLHVHRNAPLPAGVAPTPAGRQILVNFLERFT